MDEIDLITECFLDYQKFQIQLCTYRHQNFQDYLIEPTAERHFKNLWNVIVRIVQGHDSFRENLLILLDFTVFTPRYTKKFINYIFLPERTQTICETCIKNKELSEVLFNIFVQFLMPQKPRRSLEMIKCILKEYEKTDICLDNLRALLNFYTILQNIENDEQARQLIDALNEYLSFRKESQFASKISSYQYSRLLIMIFDKLQSFPSSLVQILIKDPFIFSFLECKECSEINIAQIPPFSFVAKSKSEVPKSFFMRYKEIFTQIIKMFIMFSKLYFTEEERSYLEKLTRNILSFVESGAAGRDAFIYVFLYFLRSDFLRKNAEIFLQYIREGEIKNKNSNSSSICRYNAIAIFVFSFDKDIYPSTVSLICDEYSNTLITNTLKRIVDHFPNSPFREKTKSIFEKITGYPVLKKSIFERITQVTYQIWKNGLKDSNQGNAIELLVNLTQKRSNIDSSNIFYFLQLSLAFFSKNTYNYSHFSLYCYIASVLFPIANSSLPQTNVSHFLIGSEENANDENLFLNLPQWHLLSIYKEQILLKMTEDINFAHFLSRLIEGLPPSLLLGGFLIFSKIIQNDNQETTNIFTKYCSIRFDFLSLLLAKMSLYELPEVTRESMRLMGKCQDLSFECIKSLTNTLITTAKTHKYRTFIRFLAPLFTNEKYVSQIIIRDYYKTICSTLMEFAKDHDIFASLSFIYFWRTLGTFSHNFHMKNIESVLVNLVSLSMFHIENHKNENIFFNALFELTVIHGIRFLCNVVKNTQKCPSKVEKLIVSLPKKILEKVDDEIISIFKEKISPDISAAIEKIKSSDNDIDVSIKWIPWQIDNFIYEVTGIVCTNNLNP